jgi:hypothetical protein
MRYFYFPGCTLETKAVGFNRSAKEAAGALGVELVTLPEWNCCGATFPLSTDNVLDLAGPARRSQEISASVMGDVPVLNNVGEATLTPLWQKDDLMVCQARYVVDGRDAKVVVKFAKCSDTWKIAEVAER